MQVKKRLLYSLGGWAIASVTVGTYQAARGGLFSRYMGFQHIAWGTVEGAIAGYGLYTLHRSIRAGTANDWAAERRKLRRLLLFNALLDVGYVAAGTYLVTRSDARWRGTGWGVILQGGFLLLLDSVHAWSL